MVGQLVTRRAIVGVSERNKRLIPSYQVEEVSTMMFMGVLFYYRYFARGCRAGATPLLFKVSAKPFLSYGRGVLLLKYQE